MTLIFKHQHYMSYVSNHNSKKIDSNAMMIIFCDGITFALPWHHFRLTLASLPPYLGILLIRALHYLGLTFALPWHTFNKSTALPWHYLGILLIRALHYFRITLGFARIFLFLPFLTFENL